MSSPTTAAAPAVIPQLRDIAPGVAVLDPSAGADTMAVLGAMMSRTGDLRPRWAALVAAAEREAAATGQPLVWDPQSPPTRIREFLEKNLAGYSHASIGSMAKAIFLFVSGFGWPSAWLLEDSPLFDGQEVSTRAVRAEETLGADGPGTVCRYAPDGLADLHARWLAVYAQLADHASGGGWKFDDARLFIPGTVGSGVVWTNDVRTIARLLDHIQGLGAPWDQLAAQGYAGLDALAPITTEAIARKRRPALQQWRVRPVPLSDAEIHALRDDMGAGTAVTLLDHAAPARWEELMAETEPRDGPSRHLDPLWKRTPRLRLRLRTTVAVARDWHRHRPLMPWTLAPCLDAQGCIVAAPWSPLLQPAHGPRPSAAAHQEERVGIGAGAASLRETVQTLLGDSTAAFHRLLAAAGESRGAQWQALHALPFGALVEIEAVGTLPDLLYALELRYTVQGANPEYRRQAEVALRQLGALLPQRVVAREQLLGVLARGADSEHPV